MPGYVMEGKHHLVHRPRLHRRHAPLCRAGRGHGELPAWSRVSRGGRDIATSVATGSCGERRRGAPRGRHRGRHRASRRDPLPARSRFRHQRRRDDGRRRRLLRDCFAANSGCFRPATSATASLRWPPTRTGWPPACSSTAFRNGEGLAGHALGNLILAALADSDGFVSGGDRVRGGLSRCPRPRVPVDAGRRRAAWGRPGRRRFFRPGDARREPGAARVRAPRAGRPARLRACARRRSGRRTSS